MPGTALWVDAFVCLPGFTCLPLSPFICLPLSPSLDDPVWVDGFVCLPLSFVSRCLPAWMPGTALWVDGLICLPLSPFICLPAWMPGAARVHLSPFVSLHSSPVVSQPGCLGGQIHLSPSVSLHLSPVVSQPGSGSCVSLCPLHLSPVLSQPGCLARPVASQPGCLARLSGWTGSFVSLCLPSFVSRCLPPWMPGAALCVDGFICLPLSPRMSGTPLFPFICFPLSPSLDAWHCFFGGQIHFSPFVSLHLAPVVSQPGCLSRLSRRTDSLVSLGSPSSLWVDGFICFPLSPFICLPLSPSLDAWHGSLGGRIHLSPVVSQPECVALTLRGFLHFPRFCPFGGVWFAFGFGPGFGHSLSCGCWGQGPPLSALHLDFDFAWAGSSSLSIDGYTLSVRSVPRYQLRSRADDSGALRCAASATRRLC